MNEKLLTAALGYSQGRGWSVFPCNGKRPYTSNGLHDATTDEQQVRRWWEKWPEANIGVACGPARIVVIDVDVPDGFATILALAKKGQDFPPTLSQKTGSGGAHYLYQMPAEPIRNTAGRLPGVTEATPGVDCRGDGGYIVVAPSRTEAGEYEWMKAWTTSLAAAPGWLSQQTRQESVSVPLRPLADRLDDPPSDRYGDRALEEETAAVGRAPVGTRNHQLNASAFSLGQLVAGGILDEYEVVARLAAAARAVGLDQREVAVTLRSGLEAGRSQPRSIPR